MAEPPVPVGVTLEIDENDHLYGVGRLTLKVDSVGTAERWPDDAWVAVTGTNSIATASRWGNAECWSVPARCTPARCPPSGRAVPPHAGRG